MSAKQKILSHFFRLDFPDGPVAFADLLIEAAESALGKNRIDSEAYATSRLNEAWAALIEQVDSDERSGVSPVCNIIHRYDRLVGNICASQRFGNRAKAMLRSRPSILRAIDSITDRQYEALGCYVTEQIAASRVLLTPRGNEGGVDFLATVRLHSPTHIFSGLGREFRIIGQSKKYEQKVQVGGLELFIKTVENVRHRSDRVDRILPPWFHACSGPIVGWMISHSGFQSGAISEARKHGVILSDSRDIAETLSMSRNFLANCPWQQRAANLAPSLDDLLARFPDPPPPVQEDYAI